MKQYKSDVLIIGAGPAGALASALISQSGSSVSMFEAEQFPRFSIGESLLPQSMVFLDEAGMLPLIESHGFQKKNGAAFQQGDKQTVIDFATKFSPGPHTTYEVQRGPFDHLLATHARDQGAALYYKHHITSFESLDGGPRLKGIDEAGEPFEAEGKFVLDASGFGRVLPRLLDLEEKSSLIPRKAVFSHIKDNIDHPNFDRNKILITIHARNPNLWYWLIPFSDGTSSIGAVGPIDTILNSGDDDEARLRKLIADDTYYKKIIPDYEFIRPVASMQGYSASVKSLHGPSFALLGNAAEFLDPIFSSGVTIALKSASLAAKLIPRQLRGEQVDWESEYAKPLRYGVETFRVFVQAWYEGTLQKIIMDNPATNSEFGQMIISLLAGYAWDEQNPFTHSGKRLLSIIERGVV